jgi:hypothetical protein
LEFHCCDIIPEKNNLNEERLKKRKTTKRIKKMKRGLFWLMVSHVSVMVSWFHSFESEKRQNFMDEGACDTFLSWCWGSRKTERDQG